MCNRLFGLNAFPVDVEVSMGRGKPQFEIVGLPDASVRESRERIRSALASLSIALPARQITVNLAPADVKKVGTMHDLAILLGILVCMERIPPQPENRCFLGEVSLSGHVRSISGVLPMALLAAQSGIRELFVPEENAAEASAVGIPIYGVHCLSNLLTHLEDTARPILRQQPTYVPQPEDYQDTLDFADVKGQQNAKYALEIAAAGGHNALMIGSPGSGKSMLAKRIPSILPEMTAAESMETTQIYSIAGLLDSGKPLMTKRPFRAPHHTISGAGLVGGGTIPRPGEISLAHNGLLFLDELAEFDHRTLEIMRQPLEDRRVTITRASGTVSYPCSFMLVGAMNPCPCGYYGHPKRQCTCTDRQVRQYLNRISGPLLDRIDIHVQDVGQDIPAFTEITEDALFEKVRQIFSYSLHNETISRFRRMMTIEQFRSPELAALYSRRYVGRVLDYHAGIFRALIAAGEICSEDPDTLAMLYVAPVVTLLGVCDRQPEREAECLERLRKHVGLFFRMVHGKTPESGGDDGTAR